MQSHYFINKEHEKTDYFTFSETIFNFTLTFNSSSDIFSKNQIDFGTYVLLNTLKNLNLSGNILDVGCGYGVIGIVLKKLFPKIFITMTDTNKTATELTQQNAELNQTKDYKIILSDAYQNIKEKFDYIVSNPPVKAGKKVLYDILVNAKDHLLKKGNLIFVIKNKFGVKGLIEHLKETYKTVEIIERKGGFCVVRAGEWWISFQI